MAILDRLGYDVTGIDPFPFPSWATFRRTPGATDGRRAARNSCRFPMPHSITSCVSAPCFTLTIPIAHFGDQPGHQARGRLVVRTVNRTNLYTRRTGRVIDPASKNLYSLDELAGRCGRFGFRVDEQFAYGFLPPGFKNLWWYLVSVWLPIWVQDRLSDLLHPSLRWNNTVIATAPATAPGAGAAGDTAFTPHAHRVEDVAGPVPRHFVAEPLLPATGPVRRRFEDLVFTRHWNRWYRVAYVPENRDRFFEHILTFFYRYPVKARRHRRSGRRQFWRGDEAVRARGRYRRTRNRRRAGGRQPSPPQADDPGRASFRRSRLCPTARGRNKASCGSSSAASASIVSPTSARRTSPMSGGA